MKYKSLTISKPSLPKCEVCGEPGQITIILRDPDRPGPEHWRGGIKLPSDQAWACDQHIEEVTFILLQRNGLTKERHGNEDKKDTHQDS